jgi:hypothetical protein
MLRQGVRATGMVAQNPLGPFSISHTDTRFDFFTWSCSSGGGVMFHLAAQDFGKGDYARKFIRLI